MPDGNGGDAAIFPWRDALSGGNLFPHRSAFLSPSPRTTETFLQQNLNIETAT
jgi:hypothetical protein